MNFWIQKYASLLCRLKIKEIIAVQRFSRENLENKVVPIKRVPYKCLGRIKCLVWFWIHLLRYQLYHKIIFRTLFFISSCLITFLAYLLHFSKEFYCKLGLSSPNYFTNFLVTMKIVTICIYFCILVVLYPVIPKIVLCHL